MAAPATVADDEPKILGMMKAPPRTIAARDREFQPPDTVHQVGIAATRRSSSHRRAPHAVALARANGLRSTRQFAARIAGCRHSASKTRVNALSAPLRTLWRPQIWATFMREEDPCA